MASLKLILITLLAFMFICGTSVQAMRHNHHPGRPRPGHRPGHRRPGPSHYGHGGHRPSWRGRGRHHRF